MIPEKDTPEWYLEAAPGEGRKGPFTLKDIEGLHKNGQINDQQRVSSPYLGTQTVTVAELLGIQSPTQPAPKSFSPPPRPEIERTSLTSTPGSSKINSAITLLDTLHAAKERRPKAPKQEEPPTPPVESAPNRSIRSIKNIVLGVIAFILIAVAGWVVWEKKLIKFPALGSPKTEESKAGLNPGTSTPPNAGGQQGLSRPDESSGRFPPSGMSQPRFGSAGNHPSGGGLSTPPNHPSHEEANQPPPYDAQDNRDNLAPRDENSNVDHGNTGNAPPNQGNPPDDSQNQNNPPPNPANQDPQPPQFE